MTAPALSPDVRTCPGCGECYPLREFTEVYRFLDTDRWVSDGEEFDVCSECRRVANEDAAHEERTRYGIAH